MSLAKEVVTQLNLIFSQDAVLTEAADCWAYGYDNSKLHSPPDAVVLPTTHEQVERCVQLCNQFSIPMTARGRGTGTTGASIPIRKGLVISLERMNKLLSFNRANLSVRVQTGITNQAVQEYLHAHGFFWAPDPGSAAYCSVGGNLACNAAGPRAIKYGTTRDSVLQLKAVTGSGNTIHTGSITSKGVVGLDLTRLLIGSEGTLAIITEAELKILPRPEQTNTLRVIFKNSQGACSAIENLTALSDRPAAIEFMDQHAIGLIKEYSDIDLPAAAKALLMINVDGDSSTLANATARVEAAVKNDALIEIKQASSAQDKQNLWQARKALSPILRTIAPNKINEDIVVPVPNLAAFVAALDELASHYQLPIVNFGHAGNGNLHVNIMYDASDSKQNDHAQRCLEDIFATALRLQGTLSGEHGIGLVKREYVGLELGREELALMHNIKRQFDPNNILNADKSLPSQAK